MRWRWKIIFLRRRERRINFSLSKSALDADWPMRLGANGRGQLGSFTHPTECASQAEKNEGGKSLWKFYLILDSLHCRRYEAGVSIFSNFSLPPPVANFAQKRSRDLICSLKYRTNKTYTKWQRRGAACMWINFPFKCSVVVWAKSFCCCRFPLLTIFFSVLNWYK